MTKLTCDDCHVIWDMLVYESFDNLNIPCPQCESPDRVRVLQIRITYRTNGGRSSYMRKRRCMSFGAFLRD